MHRPAMIDDDGGPANGPPPRPTAAVARSEAGSDASKSVFDAPNPVFDAPKFISDAPNPVFDAPKFNFDAPNPVSDASKFMFDASYVNFWIGYSDAGVAESAFPTP